MEEVRFPERAEWLERAEPSDRQRRRGSITLRWGKGDKDRLVPLAHAAVEPRQTHVAKLRTWHQADREAGVPAPKTPVNPSSHSGIPLP